MRAQFCVYACALTFVKVGSCQVKQSIQVVQAVNTNYVDVIAVAGLVTDR